ncbi:MAG TPA: TetR/AcrR family transcriptional regulator [Chloroflexota bacterium]|nr:TetR/AcrR family transcriptional regulator [Chloroflexota bacterium]
MEQHVNTAERILETAFELMQTRGYNAFSYADVAERVGIRTASIHYHFPAKSDLAREVCAHYRTALIATLAAIDRDLTDPADRLQRFVALQGRGLDHRPPMCLCALLAAECPTLPEEVNVEVRGFLSDQETWLTRVLGDGVATSAFCLTVAPEDAAQVLRAGLAGAMLAARASNDRTRYDTIAQSLLTALLRSH